MVPHYRCPPFTPSLLLFLLSQTQSSSCTSSCSYETNGSPFLLLQPAKKEMVQIQPHVALYHDFITDAEAETIKGLAGPWVSHPRPQGCPFPAARCPRRS